MDIHCMPYQTALTFPGMFISSCHCDITVIMKKYRSHLELVGNYAMNVQWSYWLNALLIFQLQIAFSKGLLKPGLNLEVEAPKEAINNVVSTYFNILCLIILIKHFLVWVVNVSITMIQVIVLFYLLFDCNCESCTTESTCSVNLGRFRSDSISGIRIGWCICSGIGKICIITLKESIALNPDCSNAKSHRKHKQIYMMILILLCGKTWEFLITTVTLTNY